METTAAVEPASAMEPAGCNAAVESTAYRASGNSTTRGTPIWSSDRPATTIATSAIVAATPVVTAMAPISAAIAVEPRSCSDEYSASEPTGAVITVRRAGVRRIPVIPVRANRCSISAVHGPNSNSDSNPNLGLRRRG
jgi:hypothetical protein